MSFCSLILEELCGRKAVTEQETFLNDSGSSYNKSQKFIPSYTIIKMRKNQISLNLDGFTSKSKSCSKSKDKELKKLVPSPYLKDKNKNNKENKEKSFKGKESKSNYNFDNKSKEKKEPCSKSKSRSKSKTKTIPNKESKKTLIPYLQTTTEITRKKLNKANQKEIERNLLRMCEDQIQKGELNEAQNILMKLENKSTAGFETKFLLGEIAAKRNSIEKSKNYFRECLKFYENKDYSQNHGTDNNAEKIKKVALSHYYLSHFDTAISYCNKALNINQDPVVYELKGKSQLCRFKFGPAIDSFTNALALNNKNYALHEYQGDCYKGIQAYELALNCYLKYEQFENDNIRVLLKKAECFKALGNTSKEEDIISKIATLKKENSKSNFNNLGLEKPVERKPNHEPTLLNTLSEEQSLVTSLEEVQQLFEMGKLDTALKSINMIISEGGLNLKNLHLRAEIYFSIREYDSCESDLRMALQILENPISPLITFFLPDPNEAKILIDLKKITNKLKELYSYALSEEEDKHIEDRRKSCLREALNVFQNGEKDQSESLFNSKLSLIIEESSIRSSRIFDVEENSIFLLKDMRKIIENWCLHKFSIESLEETTSIAQSLVKTRYQEFSILPTHIIFYALNDKNETKNFQKINNELTVAVMKLCEKYPPSEANISESTCEAFDIKFEKRNPKDLLETINCPKFQNYKELHKAIETIAERAELEFYQISDFCRLICGKFQGFGFKAGLKLDNKKTSIIEERVLCRIVEKMLSKEIKLKLDHFYSKIKVKPNKKMKEYFNDIEIAWEEVINEVITEKNQKKERIHCYVSDFVRAKCMFNSIVELKNITLEFIKLHELGQIILMEVDNRLGYKTKDVVLKFEMRDIVVELQLGLEFESVQNEFNHGLYELIRSPFGPFFASVMWFSGFALQKKKIFFHENIKWGLPKLKHLRKFIYEEELTLEFLDLLPGVVSKYCLINFELSKSQICSEIRTMEGKFLSIDEKGVELYETENSMRCKFVVKFIDQNLIVNETNEHRVVLRIEGQNIFLRLNENGKLVPDSMSDSLNVNPLRISMKGRGFDDLNPETINENQSKDETYEKEIERCKKLQRELNEIIRKE